MLRSKSMNINIKPNLFKDNKVLTMENEIKFILSQYSEYNDRNYESNFKYEDRTTGQKYDISINIIKEQK